MRYFSITLLLTLVFSLAFISLSSNYSRAQAALEMVPHTGPKLLSYSALMRQVKAAKVDQTDKSPLTPEQHVALKWEIASILEGFIEQEAQKLRELGISPEKYKFYIEFLNKQLGLLSADSAQVDDHETEESAEVQIPQHPGAFLFNNNPVEIRALQDITVEGNALEPLAATLEIVAVTEGYLPTIEDVQADGAEVLINAEIVNLAASLDHNPVNIFNFLRNSISYEPYYGAKKGSIGCLSELVCNDTDASSLSIALLRAAGIPARYKKSAILVPVQQLQNLLAVDETKTVYGTLARNDVPVFVVSDTPLPEDFNDYDFSDETHLALEWTFVEAFYEYDEWGANIINGLSFEGIETTEEVRDILRPYPNKQWIPIDVVMRPYRHEQKEIVHDTANFDTENFWHSYLQYQGPLHPLDKYAQDLESITGKNIFDGLYRSTKTLIKKDSDILPSTTPYALIIGTAGDEVIATETWSSLPDERKHRVTIRLLKSDDQTNLLEHTFFGSEVNNVELNLLWEGATEEDKAIIESYGGIHATPAALVEIASYLQTESARYDGIAPLAIGDSLILRFSYAFGTRALHTDEKFSVAGNHEGIYVVLSRVQENVFLDEGAEPNINSKILLAGNAALAREYLKTIEIAGDLLKQSFDYEYNINFSRAVVTQNRILNLVDGTPSTFDFKGLTIDASAYITDYSNRGDYKTHQKDFRLLWGLNASYYEGQLFTELAGLEAISTVKGLQYAYANPNEYTVHIITIANEVVIDSLELSENTRQNMRADVQNGHTIITPDKLVQKGGWRGILYISLDPEWTGTYAIGEQVVGNGGWTTSELLLFGYIDQDGKGRAGFLRQIGGEQYYYEDRKVLGAGCRISDAERTAIVGAEDWRAAFGFPCRIDSVNFGEVGHAYVLASNAAHFFSPGRYEYWVHHSNVTAQVNNYIATKKGLPQGDINRIEDGRKTSDPRFSLILGTYLQSICENEPFFGFFFNRCDVHATVYYAPDGSGGSVYRVKGKLLDKLAQNDNAVAKKVGWPTGDVRYAPPSDDVGGQNQDSDRLYQDFLNGQQFQYKAWGLTRVYYTHGRLTEVHLNQGWVSGPLGFPQRDPQESGPYVYQLFENDKEIEWNKDTQGAGVVDYIKYRCQLHGDIQDRWYAPVELRRIRLHGLLDAGIEEIQGIAQLAWTTLDALVHFQETLGNAQELLNELANLNMTRLKEVIDETGSEIGQQLTEEWESSFGERGCSARQAYLVGRVGGEVILIVSPTKISKITKATKIPAVNKLKYVNGKVYVPAANNPLARALVEKFKHGQRKFDEWETNALIDPRWKPNAHHIVPQSFPGDPRYGALIEDLDHLWGGPGQFDIHGHFNGVMLPQELHIGMHKDYFDKVHDRLRRVLDRGGTNDDVINEIEKLRTEILDGKLPLNKNWDEAANKDLIDDIRNSKYIYN